MKLTKNEIAIRGVVAELLSTMLCNGGKLEISEDAIITIGSSSDLYAVEGLDYENPTDILLVTDINSDTPRVKLIDEENKHHRNAIYSEYDPDHEPDLTGGEDDTLKYIDAAKAKYQKQQRMDDMEESGVEDVYTSANTEIESIDSTGIDEFDRELYGQTSDEFEHELVEPKIPKQSKGQLIDDSIEQHEKMRR